MTVKYVLREEILERIAHDLIAFNNKAEQNTRLLFLEKELLETEKAMDNLVKAVEQGFFNDKTQERMLELQSKKAELVSEIDDEKLNAPIPLVFDEVLYWLSSFKNGDVNCEKFCERLIGTFINRVIVWNDRIIIIFNVKENDTEQLTIDEILDLYKEKDPTETIESNSTNFFNRNVFEYGSLGEPL